MTIPKLRSVDNLTLCSREVFVAAGGFEERVLAFPKLIESRDDAHEAVLLNYRPFDEKNKLEEQRLVLTLRGFDVTSLEYDRYAPDNFHDPFIATLKRLQSRGVCLDISGMSRFAIMIIADVVRELNLAFRVVYTEAREYAPCQKDFEAAKADQKQHLPTSFIHTGVYDVLRVPQLASIRMQNRSTLLIAFDSFNEALCQAIINVINPSRFILINGRPPRPELRWREEATAYVHKRLRQEWSFEDDNDPIKVTDTLQYEETQSLLVELYWRFSGTHRIILAPTGSKMQTLGAYLLRAVHEDVHVEYPTVQGFFADKYSTGVREKWAVDFGKMGDFVTKLHRAETKEHLGLPEEPVNAEIP